LPGQERGFLVSVVNELRRLADRLFMGDTGADGDNGRGIGDDFFHGGTPM
jgi:hypothetical protein